MKIKKCLDFEVDGEGGAAQWNDADWQRLTRVGGDASYETKIKSLYSGKGIYFLFDCEDNRISCTDLEDFGDIFNEDVVELFLWPDQKQVLYFEYEISPLGVETPIIVPNDRGTFHGWLPWHFDGGRKTRKATHVRGGKKMPAAKIDGWSAEVFIPFELLSGMARVPPRPGDSWRANMYRIDYDSMPRTQWAWCPNTGVNFHDYGGFGTIIFGE